MSLRHGAAGGSAVYDCGIFWSYSLIFLFIYLVMFRCKMKIPFEYRRACFLMFGSDSISGMPDFAILKEERH